MWWGASAVLGTLDFCVVGSEAPLKSFELREGEPGENRVGFYKGHSATQLQLGGGGLPCGDFS